MKIFWYSPYIVIPVFPFQVLKTPSNNNVLRLFIASLTLSTLVENKT